MSVARVRLAALLEDWARDAEVVVSMLDAGTPPPGAPPFVDSVLVTDLAAHSHDVFGALGLVRDRDSAAVRVTVASYLAGLRYWQPRWRRWPS